MKARVIAIGFVFFLSDVQAQAIALVSPSVSRASNSPGFAPAVMLEGKAKERGCAYGKRFREEIHDFLDQEIYRAFVGRPFVKEQMLRYAADCGNVVRDGCPTIAEEFEGMADGEGRLVNLEGSPERIVVERAQDRLVRVGYGSRAMTGVKPAEPVPLHPRCRRMYDLLQASSGGNDLARLQDYFADRMYEINVGDATIDMMVFDTTARSAFLSRGSSYGLSWREFVFGAELRSRRDSTSP